MRSLFPRPSEFGEVVPTELEGLTAVTPPHAAGAVEVVGKTPTARRQLPGGFACQATLPAPTIAATAPDAGVPGNPVDITARAYELEARRPISLKLSQLNPVVRRLGLPDHKVLVHGLEQVCVPVAKNNQIPPLDVLWLVQHVDVACYRIEPLEALPSIPLRLRHLNPILLALGLPDTAIGTRPPEQLCVPVSKNGLTPPDQALSVVQWVDFEKFAVDSTALTRPVTLELNHLNPLFAQFRPFKITVGALTHLDLPVAKNGAFPPSIRSDALIARSGAAGAAALGGSLFRPRSSRWST